MHEPELLSTIRRILLALVLLGIVGLVPELLLLKHTESATQLIPLFVLGIGLVSGVVLWARPTRRGIQTFQVVMLLFIVAGLLGLYFHVRGNVEFELEQDPSAHGLDLLWRSLSGGVPTLAPGAMVQLGLLGLVFAYRHPLLRIGAASITAQERS
jgi:uncharacterized membrane protein